jgi:hypothetical protein
MSPAGADSKSNYTFALTTRASFPPCRLPFILPNCITLCTHLLPEGLEWVFPFSQTRKKERSNEMRLLFDEKVTVCLGRLFMDGKKKGIFSTL